MPRTPIFVHSLFRAGSTYVFKVFRRSAAGYWAYQEPLHEMFAADGHDAVWQSEERQELLRRRLRHPDLDRPYYFEMQHFAEDLRRGYRPEFAFGDYFLDAGEEGASLHAFLLQLITHARGRPVVLECRTPGRMGWIRAHVDALQVFLWRNPWDQWWSYRVDDYFDLTTLATYAAKNLPAPLANILGETGVVLPVSSGHLPDWESLRDATGIPWHAPTSYALFYGLWAYTALAGFEQADLSINIDGLSEDRDYREGIALALERLGIPGLDFSDAAAPRSVYSAEEREFFATQEARVRDCFLAAGLPLERWEWLHRQRCGLAPREQQSREAPDAAARELAGMRGLVLTRMDAAHGQWEKSRGLRQELDAAREALQAAERRARLAEEQARACVEQTEAAAKLAKERARLAEEQARASAEKAGAVARQALLAEETLSSMRGTLSWRITAPLRWAKALLSWPSSREK